MEWCVRSKRSGCSVCYCPSTATPQHRNTATPQHRNTATPPNAPCHRNQARENGRGRSRNSGTRQGGTLCREADAVKEWLVNYLNRSKLELRNFYSQFRSLCLGIFVHWSTYQIQPIGMLFRMKGYLFQDRRHRSMGLPSPCLSYS